MSERRASHAEQVRTVLLLLSVAVGLSGAASSQTYAQLKQVGPRSLIVLLRCHPSDRPALREALQVKTAAVLARLQKNRVLASYSILFNRFADSETWDAVEVLEFSSDHGIAQWAEVEQTMPAGLDVASSKLLKFTATSPGDIVSQRSSSAVDTRPVYMVIPYGLDVPADDYVRYAETYVVPQLNGWMQKGVLSSWKLLVSRYGAGRAAQAELILGYRDEQALGARERTVSEVREALSHDPQWKAASEDKHKIRTELAAFTAELLAGSN